MLLTMGEFMQVVVPRLPNLRFNTKNGLFSLVTEGKDGRERVDALASTDILTKIGVITVEHDLAVIEIGADRQGDQEAADALDETRPYTDDPKEVE